MLLVSCSMDEAIKMSGETFSNGEKVLLNIEVDGKDVISAYNFMLRSRNVRCVTVISGYEGVSGIPEEIPDGKSVFVESSYPEMKMVKSGGSKVLIRLPDSYSNMRELYDISCRNTDYEVHFIGGRLLEIEGIHIGRYDTGKEKLGAYFDGIYDSFVEVKYQDLDKIEVLKSKLNKCMLKDIGGIGGGDKKEKKASVSKQKYSAVTFFGDSVDF